MGELSRPEDHVVTVKALCDKRAEVSLQLTELERRMDQLRAELVHIDAVIRLFRPNFDPNTIPGRKRRHVRSDYFAHGEISRRAYEAMQDGKVVQATDIAFAAMQDKGLDPATTPRPALISFGGSHYNSTRSSARGRSRRSGKRARSTLEARMKAGADKDAEPDAASHARLWL